MLILEQAPEVPPRLVLVLQAEALSGLTKVAVLLVPHLAVLVFSQVAMMVVL